MLTKDKPIDQAPYYQRKIRCPGNYLIPPQIDVYLREPVSLLRDCSNFVEIKGQRIKIRKYRITRDRFGRKKLDWKKIYELRDKGVILQPWITASEAIEKIYDPLSVLCFQCKKHCLEGKGGILMTTIKRLMGIPMKRK